MAQCKCCKREEVINKLNVLLEQHAPSLMDAITNEHTDFDGEELLILAEQTTKPMAQQTAVEWLVNHWKKLQSKGEKMSWQKIIDITELAKQREREQKIEFANKYADDVMAGCLLRAEQYYNEIYGNNQNK